MKESGFTDQEFSKMAEAKANSDALTSIEFAAMALIESGHVTEADRIKAIEMLFSDDNQHAKAQIMRPIAELNQMVDSRTKLAVARAENIALAVRFRSVTQENLASIEAERVRANRLKDEFVSTVSHELRTPLTAIRGAVGLPVA